MAVNLVLMSMKNAYHAQTPILVINATPPLPWPPSAASWDATPPPATSLAAPSAPRTPPASTARPSTSPPPTGHHASSPRAASNTAWPVWTAQPVRPASQAISFQQMEPSASSSAMTLTATYAKALTPVPSARTDSISTRPSISANSPAKYLLV